MVCASGAVISIAPDYRRHRQARPCHPSPGVGCSFGSDLVIRPPNENKYVAIKNRLLQKFGESPESKLRRLLQGRGTSGLKPSEVLANMRRLAPDPGSENIILTLFLAEMPASIRPTLTVWGETDLDKHAKIADKMLEAVSHNATFATSTNTTTASGPSVWATSTEGPWKKINVSNSKDAHAVHRVATYKLEIRINRHLGLKRSFASTTTDLEITLKRAAHHAPTPRRSTKGAVARHAGRRQHEYNQRAHSLASCSTGAAPTRHRSHISHPLPR